MTDGLSEAYESKQWDVFVENNDLLLENDQLKAENAKLRKLVRDVWHLFTEHGAVHPCDLPVVDAVRDRMRELGIEVDA